LLEAGADLHANDDSFLMFALWRVDIKTVRLLLAHGADPNSFGLISLCEKVSSKGSQRKRGQILRALMAAGAKTPFRFGDAFLRARNNPYMLRILLGKCAEPERAFVAPDTTYLTLGPNYMSEKFELCRALVHLASVDKRWKASKIRWVVSFSAALNSWPPVDGSGYKVEDYNKRLVEIHRAFSSFASPDFVHTPSALVMAQML